MSRTCIYTYGCVYLYYFYIQQRALCTSLLFCLQYPQSTAKYIESHFQSASVTSASMSTTAVEKPFPAKINTPLLTTRSTRLLSFTFAQSRAGIWVSKKEPFLGGGENPFRSCPKAVVWLENFTGSLTNLSSTTAFPPSTMLEKGDIQL